VGELATVNLAALPATWVREYFVGVATPTSGALAEPRGMRPLVAHCHLGLGKLYRRTGKRAQAGQHLTAATTMYREMDMTYWLVKAEREHGRAAT